MKNDFEVNKSGTLVIVKNNDVNRALRKLKKKMQQERVLQDYRKKEYYEKPTERKKREKAAARKRWLKKQAEIKSVL